MAVTRRLFPTRLGQMHVRSAEGHGVPLLLLHMSPRSGAMWEGLQSTLEALNAAVLVGPFDVLGIHVGAVEALEIAHLAPAKVRRLVMMGVPLFTPEEQQRQMEKYSEQPLKPATEGGHVLAAWRSSFAFRHPPYDLADVQSRFVEQVLAANPGAASKAAGGYPLEKKLKTVKVPLTVFAPHDDMIEQTVRVKPLLKPDNAYVDLPGIAQDPFHVAIDRMVELVNRYLPS